ncbi:Aldo/keto reductase family protein [Lactiplantibacillus plantarum subsp. plantarum]|nr:Aldo/keto reductase family protein [Lactiplantibacillus plantarum subsp. plantarum]
MYQASQKRYDHMIYNRVGNSGLKLSAIGLGLWNNLEALIRSLIKRQSFIKL